MYIYIETTGWDKKTSTRKIYINLFVLSDWTQSEGINPSPQVEISECLNNFTGTSGKYRGGCKN